MAFKSIRTDDADLTRVQQNIATAFQDITTAAATAAPGIASAVSPQYRVASSDDFVLVDPSKGAVVVVLPAAAPRALVVKATVSSPNKVTVQAVDGAAIDGSKVAALPDKGSIRLACDGRAWWSY